MFHTTVSSPKSDFTTTHSHRAPERQVFKVLLPGRESKAVNTLRPGLPVSASTKGPFPTATSIPPGVPAGLP